MKPCDSRWHEELLDHALGLSASAALVDHLATCAACSATLRDWKERMGQVDAGIRRLAASEPSPHAASRLMAEVRARSQRGWLRGWRWRTAALCGLVVAIALVDGWKVHEQRKEAERVLSAASAIDSWRSPTESLLRSSDRWLKPSPQFGTYFYPLKAKVPEKEEENP